MENINKNKNAAKNKIIKDEIATKLGLVASHLSTLSFKNITKKELLDNLSEYILYLLDILVYGTFEEKVRMKINNIIYKLVEIKGPLRNSNSSVNNNVKKATMMKNIKDYSNELLKESFILKGESNLLRSLNKLNKIQNNKVM